MPGERYRGERETPRPGTPQPADSATARDVLENPHIILTPVQQADVRSGDLDARVISSLAWIGRRHRVLAIARVRRPAGDRHRRHRVGHAYFGELTTLRCHRVQDGAEHAVNGSGHDVWTVVELIVPA